MIEKLMTMLVGILLALAGWSLSRTFELSTIQAVHEDKVQRIQAQVLKIQQGQKFLSQQIKKNTNFIKRNIKSEKKNKKKKKKKKVENE